MKLKNENMEIELGSVGEIISMKFNGQETLHNGQSHWSKTYPIIWPNIGISKSFVVNNTHYILPKHGFWKDLDWDFHNINTFSIAFDTTHYPSSRYPFNIYINNVVTLTNQEVIFKTIFKNLGVEDAYFFFGHHPAFIINSNSKWHCGSTPTLIDLKGWHHSELISISKINKLPFGELFDTLVYKNISPKKGALINDNYNIEIKFEDFDSLQLWKPKDAPFLCIEPWQGWNDPEYDSPTEVNLKKGIIKLKSQKEREFTVSYKFSNNKP